MRSVSILARNARIGDSIKGKGKVKAVETFEGQKGGQPHETVLLVTTTLKTVHAEAGDRITVNRPRYNYNAS